MTCSILACRPSAYCARGADAKRAELRDQRAGLDAGDWNRAFRMRRHEDAQVQYPILLRADQFLAIEQQHRLVALVEDLELRHSACLARFLDPDRAQRKGFVEDGVVCLAGFIRHERNQCQVPECLRRSKRDGAHRFEHALYCCHRISLDSMIPAPGYRGPLRSACHIRSIEDRYVRTGHSGALEEPVGFRQRAKKQRTAQHFFRRCKRTVESGVRRGCTEVAGDGPK